MTDQSEKFLLTIKDHVAEVTLNDAARRNALSSEMIADLRTVLNRLETDKAVRVIVLGHTGPAFSAGHDLKEMKANRNADFYKKLFADCSALMTQIVKCPKPIIAKVNGVATAAGCQLVASCDLAYVSDMSRFATPGVNIGLFCSTPMVALSRNVGRKQAMEMLLSGDLIAAEEAQRIGLVNKVLPVEDLDQAVAEMAQKIAAKSSRVLAIGKEAFYTQLEMGLSDAYAYTSDVMQQNMMLDDAEEGIAAFIEKRHPNWPE